MCSYSLRSRAACQSTSFEICCLCLRLRRADVGDDAKDKQHPPGFYDRNLSPPDDAPAEDLLYYWERHANTRDRGNPKPSDAVIQRLLAACEAQPERLPPILDLLPDTAAERVKKIYDDARADEGWREIVAYIATHGKMLLHRARDENNESRKSVGPDAEEFYLLDAATGQTQLVAGILAPLQRSGSRFLQPTGKPAEFWAAIPDRSKGQTRVGRYNLKDSSFQPSLVVPSLVFDSLSMWVDQAGATVYIVYEGQLLRLPFQN